jgi:ubiquinone/menaquinone biosynthesis C-methylase UbiE
MASASTLPFGDDTLGAVICWNALQAFPDDAPAAIAEVGRCLREGGTFTILTFRRPEDPVYKYFQSCHYFPQHGGGLQLIDIDELHSWIADAGLEIRDESGPGTFVFLTAEKPRSNG